MAHEWEILEATQESVVKYGWGPRRRCVNCGAIQQRYSEHSWMRVTGYSWQPLVGRCKKGNQMRQPIKCHGGKSYLAKKIVALMPPRCKNPNAPKKSDKGWVHYVEPYFGGGAVALSLDPRGISIVVNDVNRDITNFWDTLSMPGRFKKFVEMCEKTPFSTRSFERAERRLQQKRRGTRESDCLARAHAFFIINRQSRQALGTSFATMTRNRTRQGMNEQVSAWLSSVEGLPEVHAFLKQFVVFTTSAADGVKVIEREDGDRTLYYLDPTYLPETRAAKKAYGKHEMTVEDHERLLELLPKLNGRFLLSGYRSKMYDDAAKKHKWRRVDFEIDNKSSNKRTEATEKNAKGKDVKVLRKEKKIECVWMNYNPLD